VAVLTKSGKTKYVEKKPDLMVCDYSNSPTYQICAEMKDCDICNNINFCGWCQKANKCIPGTHRGPDCEGDCLANWVFNDPTKCEGKVRSGRMSNVEHLATKLINPEITGPKLKK